MENQASAIQFWSRPFQIFRIRFGWLRPAHLLGGMAYYVLYLVVYGLSLLPMGVLYGFGRLAYLLSYHVCRYRRDVVLQNIARCFPEKCYGEVGLIARQFYRSFTAYFSEIIKAVSVAPEVLDRKVVMENAALLDGYIQQGRPVICCLGHCGNWEMISLLPYLTGHEVFAVYKPLRSLVMDRLMAKLRSRFGMKLVADRSVVRQMCSVKPQPALYLFLADQCPSIKEEKYRFSLLDQDTYLFSGMEKLARRSGAAVVYLRVLNTGRGRYEISCIPMCDNADITDEGEISRRYAELLSENIRVQPHGWLWSHRRWKR